MQGEEKGLLIATVEATREYAEVSQTNEQNHSVGPARLHKNMYGHSKQVGAVTSIVRDPLSDCTSTTSRPSNLVVETWSRAKAKWRCTKLIQCHQERLRPCSSQCFSGMKKKQAAVEPKPHMERLNASNNSSTKDNVKAPRSMERCLEECFQRHGSTRAFKIQGLMP